MRAANTGPAENSVVSGGVEKKLGSLVGCEGMVENGGAKERKD